MRFRSIQDAVWQIIKEIEKKYPEYDLSKPSQCIELSDDLKNVVPKNYKKIKENIRVDKIKEFLHEIIQQALPNSFIKSKGISNHFKIRREDMPKVLHGAFVTTVEIYAIFLGYMGWKGFIKNPPLGIDEAMIQFPINDDIENITDEIDSKTPFIQDIKETRSIVESFQQFMFENPENIGVLLSKKSKYFKERVINILNSQHTIEYLESLTSNSDETLSKFFDDILECEKLSDRPLLKKEIELFLSYDACIKYHWYHRAILASILSLSLITKWDSQKIRYLKELAELKNEPLVSRRAIVGLALGLIVSFQNTHEFQKTVRLMYPFNGSLEFIAGIYEGLRIFFTKQRTLIEENKSETETYEIFSFSSKYQYFEPLHAGASFVPNMKSKFINNDDKLEILELLNFSNILSHQIKVKILQALKRLTDTSVNSLLLCLKFEESAILELEKESIYKVYEYRYQLIFLEFISHLKKFNKHKSSITSTIDSIDFIQFAHTIFHHFPYHRYLNIIPLQLQEVYRRISCLNDQVFYDIGLILRELDKKEKALEAFYKVVKVNQKHINAWLQIGILQSEKKENMKALDAFENAINIDVNSIEAWYYKGTHLFYNMGKKEEAIRLIDKKSRDFSMTYISNIVDNIELLLDVNNEKNIEAKYELQLLKKKSGLLMETKGRLLNDANKKEKALVCYEKLILTDPSNCEYKQKLGRLYFELKKIDSAKKEFQTILEFHYKKASTLMNLAHCELILGNRLLALKEYRKSLDLWDCSQQFFDNFDDDFQYIEDQGVFGKEYQEIRNELVEYCKQEN